MIGKAIMCWEEKTRFGILLSVVHVNKTLRKLLPLIGCLIETRGFVHYSFSSEYKLMLHPPLNLTFFKVNTL